MLQCFIRRISRYNKVAIQFWKELGKRLIFGVIEKTCFPR